MALFVEEAVLLARAGFYLIPVIRGTKKPALPATGRGHADKASNDPEQAWCWFEPDQHDVGIVPWLSGHVVIDVDTKHGQPGSKNIVRLEQEHCYWPWRLSDVTATATSRNGGWHHWFSLPAGVAAHDLRGELAPGVELQRYLAVSPPSPGRRWIRPPAGDIIELPTGLLELARRPEPKPVKVAVRKSGRVRPRNLDRIKAYMLKAPPGERHNTLRWAACEGAGNVERGQTSVAEVLSLVETAAAWTDMPEAEATAVVHWGLERVLGAGWAES